MMGEGGGVHGALLYTLQQTQKVQLGSRNINTFIIHVQDNI